jgi:hypothetical protein
MQDTGLYDAGYWTLGCRILDLRIEDILDFRLQDTRHKDAGY